MIPFPITKKTVAAMIHVPALPGTPHSSIPVPKMIPAVRNEAKIYRDHGADAILVENMHDRPYLRGDDVGHEITAALSVLAAEIKDAAGLPCGIQILAAANKQALACAHANNLDFIRAEGFAFTHVADEGLIDSNAAELLRYRKSIGAENIAVLTDIKKKHSSHAITADIDVVETAHAASFFLSDGLILTGAATGREADLEEVRAVKNALPDTPLVIGSGTTPENIRDYLALADGVIVGTAIKQNTDWTQPPDPARLKSLLQAARP
ncbi:MAG: BtpA/SgcQ family protein [Verrucomicrobiota bacterium]